MHNLPSSVHAHSTFNTRTSDVHPAANRQRHNICHMRHFNKIESGERNFVCSRERQNIKNLWLGTRRLTMEKYCLRIVRHKIQSSTIYSYTLFKVCVLHCIECISIVHIAPGAINCRPHLLSFDPWVTRSPADQAGLPGITKWTLWFQTRRRRRKTQTPSYI